MQHVKTYLACNFKVNLITHLEVIAHFSSNFKNVNNFHPLFKNYKRYMLSVNWKHVQLVKIYMPCNFEVNLVTRLGIFALFFIIFLWGIAITWRPSSVIFHILIFSSETTWPNGTKLGSKHLCKVLYKVSPFRSVPPTNMATKGNSCFWLATV